MTIRWLASAADDLAELEASIARRSPQNAFELVQRILDRIDRLESQPRSGAVVAEYNDNSIREVFEKPYRVIYRVYEDRVEIVSIVHGGQPLPTQLR